MAWSSNANDSQEVLLVVALIIVAGFYVIFTYVSKAVLVSFFGTLLILALLGIIGWYGFKYYRMMRMRRKPPVSLSTPIDAMDKTGFEKYLVDMFRDQGYEVFFTPDSPYGVDILLEKDGVRTAVQARRQSEKVDVSTVQEAIAGMKRYDTPKAMVVSSGDFTKTAEMLARANDCTLIDRSQLMKMLKSPSH